MRHLLLLAALLWSAIVPTASAASPDYQQYCYNNVCYASLELAEQAMKAHSVYGSLLQRNGASARDSSGVTTFNYKVDDQEAIVHAPVHGIPSIGWRSGGWGCVNNDPKFATDGCNEEAAAAAYAYAHWTPLSGCVVTSSYRFVGDFYEPYRQYSSWYSDVGLFYMTSSQGTGYFHRNNEQQVIASWGFNRRRIEWDISCASPDPPVKVYMFVEKQVTITCPAGFRRLSEGEAAPIIGQPIATGKWCRPNAALPKIYGKPTKVCTQKEGNPCHPATGSKSRSEVDFQFAGRPFVRYYDSQPPLTKSTMGRGWSHTYSARISKSAFLDYIADNGTMQAAKLVTTGLYRLENSADAIIRTVTEGAVAYRLTKSSGEILEFDTTGQLLSLRDPNHPAGDVQLVYENGLLKKVVDVGGRALTFEYDQGWVSRIWLPDGTSIAYDHDSEFNLTAADYGNGQVKRYHYRDIDNPEALYDNHLTGITSEDGAPYGTFEYDLSGRVISSGLHGEGGVLVDRRELTYDTTNQTTVTTALGGRRVYTMQPGLYRRILSVADQEKLADGTFKAAGTTSYTYLTDGRLATSTDKKGVVTTYAYASTYLSSVTSATGKAEEQRVEYGRDASNRLNVVRRFGKENGNQVLQRVDSIVYDAGGRRTYVCAADAKVAGATNYVCGSQAAAPEGVRQTRLTYCEQAGIDTGICPLLGQVIAVDGPRTDVSDITTYTYRFEDADDCDTAPTTCAYRKGDLWKVTNAVGHVNEVLAYDGAGRVLSAKDATGVVTDMAYHARGWPTAIKVRGTDDGSEADDQITRIDYFATGRVQKVTLPDGNFTRFTYDPALRLTDVTDAEGNRLHFTLDGAGNRAKEEVIGYNGAVLRTLSRIHDTVGNLRTQKDAYDHATQFTVDTMGDTEAVTDALNRVADMDYDPLGRLTKSIQDVGGINATTQFKYDAQDNLAEVVDPKNLSTKYTYNGFGEVTRLESPDTGVTTYTYDSAGNLKTKTDARGVTATYAYDAIDRVLSVTYPDSNVSQTYTWDEGVTTCPATEQFQQGRLAKLKNGTGVTFLRYCYDRFGNVTRKIQTVNGKVFSAIYSYTANSQLKSLTYPGSGMVVDYVRDALGRTTEVGVTRPGQARHIVLTAAGYYPFGPASEWVFGNGRLFRRTLNDNYQPGVVQDEDADGLSFGYEFDAVGNLSVLRDGNQANPPKRTFGYDALNRLTETTNGSTTAVLETYTYDATGNRLSVTDNGVTSTYTMAGASHRVYNANGLARGYDEVSNTTSIGGTERQFTYNDANRMNYVRRNGAAAQYYEYNGKGERIRSWLTGTDNVYTMYDEAGHWLGEYDNAGTPIQQVIWLDDLPVGLVVGDNAANQPVHYIEADALGTPRRIIDGQRDVALWNWPLTGEAFGNDAPIEDADGDGIALVFNLRFPGQRYDAHTGLNYNYFRDYDPSTGRYLEGDPIGFRGGLNLFGYVSGKPLIRKDTFGLLESTDFALNNGYEGERGSFGQSVVRDLINTTMSVIGFDMNARKLNRCEMQVLSKYHPEDKLRDVTVHGHMPWFVVDGFNGITLGNDVYLENDRPDTYAGIATMAHETTHVIQQQRWDFIPRYLWGSILGLLTTGDRGEAHDSIGLEKEGSNMGLRVYGDMLRSEGPVCGCE